MLKLLTNIALNDAGTGILQPKPPEVPKVPESAKQSQPPEVTKILESAKQPPALQKTLNTLAQTSRVIGGIFKGATKVLAAPGLLKESISNKYNNKGQAANWVDPYASPITDMTKNVISGIDNKQNEWTPAPQTAAAEFTAKAANVIGEALPIAGLAVAGGATSALGVLAGNTLSYAAGSAQAISSELLEGSGDPGRALLKGATSYVSEKIGGATVDKLAGKIASPVLSGALSAVGEGLEENIDSGITALVTGEQYTMSEAVEDFALGTAAGAVIGGTVNAANSVNEFVTPKLVERAVNTQIQQAAKSDVKNVAELVNSASESVESAIIAQDSLTALQKSTANPTFETESTSNIPSSVAERFKLVPAEGSANPITINRVSYEAQVNSLLQESGLTTRDVSTAERATANPNAIESANPRALYQYADDIYIRPGTDTNQYFTYRGQANQFYSSSVENGIPASAKGTSWEGKGVYSSPTPYTTDLYGPSGKLADNPYINRGIDQTSIKSDYPVGVILAQSNTLTEETGRLTRTDAPEDVVAEGTRRIRYDPNGRLVTEVVNNPADVEAVGLNFGRTTIENATPIEYAQTQTNTNQQVSSDSVESVQSPESVRNMSGTLTAGTELNLIEETGSYTVPKLINESVKHSANVSRAIEETERETQRASDEITSFVNASETPETAIEAAKNVGVPLTENAVNSTNESMETATANAETVTASKLNSGYSSPTNAYSNIRNVSSELTGYASEIKPAEYSPQEEKARSIWMPGEYNREMLSRANNDTANANDNNRQDRDRDRSSYDWNITRGNGATGRVYETERYNTTFGALSSY